MLTPAEVNGLPRRPWTSIEHSKAASHPPSLKDDIEHSTAASSFTSRPPLTGELLAPLPISPSRSVAALPDIDISPSDPLIALGFDIIYEILPYLQVGDVLSLQATSKTWYGALGGCRSLWRKRVEAAVSARRMKELDGIVSTKVSNAEQDGQPLKPYEISKFLRTTCK